MANTPYIKYLFRKERVRNKVFGTPERPRLSVYRSLKHIYAQIIDDTAGKTLVSASSLEATVKKGNKSCGNIKSAQLVGQLIAEKSAKSNIKKVVFDRGGRLYNGCVKALAESAREKGMDF